MKIVVRAIRTTLEKPLLDYSSSFVPRIGEKIAIDQFDENKATTSVLYEVKDVIHQFVGSDLHFVDVYVFDLCKLTDYTPDHLVAIKVL